MWNCSDHPFEDAEVVVALSFSSCQHGADRQLLKGKESNVVTAVAILAVALLLAMVVIDRLAR